MKDNHELTFVGRFDGRMVDGTLEDQVTRVGIALPSLPDETRLLRGIPSLLSANQEQKCVQYGLIGPSGTLEAHGMLHCDSNQVATAVIGRHSHTDARGVSGNFALRHALLVRPKHFNESLRVFDLSGFGGTTTLAGEPIRSASIDLPFVLRLGSYLLVAFESEHRSLGAAGIVELSAATLVRNNAVGTHADRFLFTLDDLSRSARSDAEKINAQVEFPPTGEINLTRLSMREPQPTSRQVVFRPNAEALARGFLLGRYDRCGAPGAMAWDDNMSRVHALLFSVGDDVYLTDLGSTNGTKHASLGDLRLKHIEDGDQFRLGDTRLRVESCS